MLFSEPPSASVEDCLDVKGTAVETTMLFVRERYGEEGYQRWLAALSPESREIVTSKILPSAWYPLEQAYVAPTRVVCEQYFGGAKRGAFEVGRYSALRALTGIYKMFVKIGSPAWLMERGSKVFETYYRPSHLEVVDRKDGGCRMLITDIEDVSGYVENRIAGWADAAIEIHGYKTRKVIVTRSISTGDPRTELELTWS
jgi:hypothetical protein